MTDPKKIEETMDEITEEEFYDALSEIFQNILDNQEPLGAEFEDAINENIPDLYAE